MSNKIRNIYNKYNESIAAPINLLATIGLAILVGYFMHNLKADLNETAVGIRNLDSRLSLLEKLVNEKGHPLDKKNNSSSQYEETRIVTNQYP